MTKVQALTGNVILSHQPSDYYIQIYATDPQSRSNFMQKYREWQDGIRPPPPGAEYFDLIDYWKPATYKELMEKLEKDAGSQFSPASQLPASIVLSNKEHDFCSDTITNKAHQQSQCTGNGNTLNETIKLEAGTSLTVLAPGPVPTTSKLTQKDERTMDHQSIISAGTTVLNPVSTVASPTFPFWIHTTHLFNSKTKSFNSNISLQVSPKSGLIIKTHTRSSASIPSNLSTPQDLDLRYKTILPGLVDAHTHIFVHPYSEVSSLNQERDESITERTLRASSHCRLALKAGFTTYRDLGTEGCYNADIGVRDAINRGLIPGPRLFVATEPLASSGSYEIRQENKLGGTSVPRLSDPCDGIEGCRAGVRRRIGAGADVIKFYAEYRRRTLRWPQPTWKGCPEIEFPPSRGEPEQLFRGKRQRNPNSVMWSQAEMDVMVEEAKRARAPVAAHASSGEAMIMAAKAGVTSIEHGMAGGEEALKVLKERGTIFVPTLSVVEAEGDPMGLDWEYLLEYTKKAWEMGVRLACGGDTGASAHGRNSRELELMVKAGVPVVEVLRAATLGGWEACGEEEGSGCCFGWLGEGWVADLVALNGRVEEEMEVEDFEKAIRNVSYVVKDGRLVVVDGRIVE